MTQQYKELKRELRRRQRGVILRRLARYGLTTASVALLLMAVLQLFFAFFPWTLLPLLWDTAVVACACALVYVVLHVLVIRRFTLDDAGRALECHSPGPHRFLSVALQLARQAAPSSHALVDETIRRARESLRELPRTIPGVYRHRTTIVFFVAVCSFVASAAWLSPRLASHWDLPLTFFAEVRARVAPGTIAVPRNSPVTLSLTPTETPYPVSRLRVSYKNRRGTTHMLRADSAGVFTHTIDSLGQSCVYRFSLGGTVFPPETIRVVPPPSLYTLQLSLTPPRYTGLSKRTLPEGQGNFSAYLGTRMAFTAGSSFPLREAWFIPSRGDSVPLEVAGNEATGTIRLWRQGSYTFGFVDTLGQLNDSLPSFFVDIIPDEKPFVRFLKPGIDRDLTSAQIETLVVEGVDDLGVKHLSVRYCKANEDSVRMHQLSPSSPERTVRRSLVWHLAPLSLYPGDTVFYWAQARDNKPFGKPNLAVSDTFWFRVPGFDEIYREVAEQSDYAQETMESVRRQQDELRKRFSELMESTHDGKKETTWEEKQILEDMQRQMAQQQDSLQSAVESLQETIDRLREEEFSSEEVLEKMEEVRNALKELVEEYGDSLLFEPMEPDEEITFDDMRKAMKRMEEALPELEEHLENALKYLEALRKDQERAALAEQLERLAQEQQKVASMDNDAAQMRHQEDLMRKARELADRIEKRMQPGSEDQLFDRKDVPSLAQMDSLRKAMQQSLQSQSMPSPQSMNRMSSAAMAAAEQMRSMMNSAMLARMMQEQQLLLDMANDALTMAEWQKQQIADMPRGERADAARMQQALSEALRKSMAKLDSLRMLPPQLMQKLLKNYDAASAAMDKALAAMDGPGYRRPMSQAAAGLNGVAQALLQANGAMQGMMGGGGCQGQGPMPGGLTGAMRRLSGKQAAINSATGQLLQSMLSGKRPGRGTRGGQGGQSAQDLRRQAQQAQEALAEQLKQLAQQYAEEGGGGNARLKKLEEEARRLARMLEKPSEQLRDRQDRFLARMLQSTLSVHKQGKGKEKRESKTARTVFVPTDTTETSGGFTDEDTFYRLRRKAFQGNIPPDYRPAVKSYFDSLGVLFLGAEAGR